MKHILLILVSILFFSNLLSAQPAFSVSPHSVEQVFRADLEDPYIDLKVPIEIRNTGSDTLRLLWRRYEMDRPSSWLTQISDAVTYYNPSIDTNYDPANHYTDPLVLSPGSTSTLFFHILPNGIAGAGIYDLEFSTLEKPDQILETVVLRTKVEAKKELVSPEAAVRTIRLFPNPATEYIELTDSRSIDQLVVYNLLGRRVRTFRVMEGKRYYLTGLPDGMYLIGLFNAQRGILRTLRLSKRSFRP